MSYIEGGIPVLGLDHFVCAHILYEESDYFTSMLYEGYLTRQLHCTPTSN
jgi:hypothetical protein